MAVRLPDFQAIGYSNVNPGDVRPTYSGADPEAAALAQLGQGQQQFGKGVETIAGAAFSELGREQFAKNKLTDALAQATLYEKLGDIRQQLAHETDPEKVNQHYSNARAQLDAVAQSIPDPTARQLWTAQHLDDVSKVQLVARERQQGIFKDRLLAGSQDKIDVLLRQAQQSSDPALHQQANKGIGDIYTYLTDAGAITAAQAQGGAKKAHEALVSGHVHYLLANDLAPEADAYLDREKNVLDPTVLDPLKKMTKGLRSHKIANEFGDAVSQGRQPGSAIPYPPAADLQSGTGLSAEQINTLKGHLLQRESGGNYGARPETNPHGYMGGFQMGGAEVAAKRGAGYNTIAPAAKRLGIPVPTTEKFLADPELQNQLFDNYLLANHNELMQTSPKYAAAGPEERAAILAGSHIGGVAGVRRYVERGQDSPPDAYGTRVSDYVKSAGATVGPGGAAAAGAPAQRVPSLDEQIQQVETSNLEPDEKELATARVLRNDARRRAVMRTEIARTKQLIADDAASTVTFGKIVPEVTRERVAAALGEEAADKFEDDRDTGLKFYEQTQDFDHLPPLELHRRLNMMAEAGGGMPGAEKQRKLFHMAEKKAADLEEQRLKDPSAAVSRFPAVLAASQGANLNQPETYRPLVEARIQAMSELDLPFDAMVPISNDEAASLYRPIGAAAASWDGKEVKRALSRVIQTLQTGWGGYSDVALATVLKAGHADLATREAALEAVKALSESRTPTASQSRAVDEAAKAAAIGGAVTGLTPETATATARVSYPAPDPEAITLLRANPQSRDAFDATYGPGAAEKIFAVAPPREPAQKPGERGRR